MAEPPTTGAAPSTQANTKLHDGLLSPATSTASSTTTTTHSNRNTPSNAAGLPRPRGSPLRPGSSKEDMARHYIEDRIMHINRRYVKKFSAEKASKLATTSADSTAKVTPIITSTSDTATTGYKSLSELCVDISALVNIIWLTGTPWLQVPYLLNLANELTEWMRTFPATASAQNALLAVLRKLDYCFASLLAGRDLATKETLPGSSTVGKEAMTRTDMVRCKGIVEATRVAVADLMRQRPVAEVEEDEDGMDEGPEIETTDDEGVYSAAESDVYLDPNDEDGAEYYMGAGQVYENTLVQLGKVLGDSSFSLP